MSTLEEAEEAHEAARTTHGEALSAANAARARASDLRNRVATGEATDIGPSVLAEADDHANHAALVAEGSARSLAQLGEAVQAARADAECDQVVSTLPDLGTRVLEALARLVDDLDPLIAAATAYDNFAAYSVHRIRTTALSNPRAKIDRFSTPSVDRMPLGSCRGASQLARALVPAMEALDAPGALVEGLRELAAGAPALPTT